MKNRQRFTAGGSDEFDILSAIWILACNDENSIITYEGIRYRLGLPDNYDVKALVQARGELFRPRVLQSRLEKWQRDMLSGRQLPSWIRDKEDEADRKRTIESLTPEHVFRSQFRAEQGAPPTEIQIIDWGLQHLDRLRKANLEASQSTATRQQMYIVFMLGALNIAATILVGWLTAN